MLDVLGAEGWFDRALPYETSINFTRGACLWLMLTRRGVCDTYVKFSDCVSLEQEAQRCQEASRAYADLAPRFVGYRRRDGLEILVCRAVDHVALNADSARRPAAQSRLFRDMVHYFAAQASVHLPSCLTPMPNADLVNRLQTYASAVGTTQEAQPWLGAAAARRIEALPLVPQHGDLVLNNIGLDTQGAVVVFDWEDFGATCLPGLDLFTLELSLADGADAMLAARSRPGSPVQNFLHEACHAIGMEMSDYLALAPVYALVFRYLKRNYGPEARGLMDDVLARVLHLPSPTVS